MSFFEYLADNWEDLLTLTLEHAGVVALSVLIATVLAVGLGVLVYRRGRARTVALAVTGAFLTIPSFALFGLLIPLLGLGFKPTVVALVMYGLLPVLRNTVTGLREVDPAVLEAARGMGMSARRCLTRIELPLAWPVILAGIRVSALLLLGIAAVAGAVNGPGLGDDIFLGLSRIGLPIAVHLALGGVLGIMLLALIFDGVLNGLRRITTPRGIRG